MSAGPCACSKNKEGPNRHWCGNLEARFIFSPSIPLPTCGFKLIRMFRRAPLHWTGSLVVLGLLAGVACPIPIARTARGGLGERWDTLLSRSLHPISGRKLDLGWDKDYFRGIKRVRRLYCNGGIGFHLQITSDGQICGAHSENEYSRSQEPSLWGFLFNPVSVCICRGQQALYPGRAGRY